MVNWNIKNSKIIRTYLVKSLLDVLIAKDCIEDVELFESYLSWIESCDRKDVGSLMPEFLVRKLVDGCNNLVVKGYFEWLYGEFTEPHWLIEEGSLTNQEEDVILW